MEQIRAAITLIALLLVLLSFKAGSIGLALWLDAACPTFTGRMHRLYQGHPRRCALVGLINGVLLVFLGLILLSTKVLGLLGVILIASVIAMGTIGYACAYNTLADRLLGAQREHWRHLLIGGMVAEIAFMAPVAGQLLSLGVLLRGLGAVILALVRKNTHTQISN